MIIRRALSQDIAELADFNIRMAHETEGVELIPEVITAGVKTMIDNPQMGFYLVVELDNGIQASLMITTEWSDWRERLAQRYFLVDSKRLRAARLSPSGPLPGAVFASQRACRAGTGGMWLSTLCRARQYRRSKNL
jgi:hypothetical protein